MKAQLKPTELFVFKMPFYLRCDTQPMAKEDTSACIFTCTAESQVVPGGGAEFNTAHISLRLDACHRVVQVGGPQLHYEKGQQSTQEE